MRAHALRASIYNREQKLAVAYPDDRQKLGEEIAELIEEHEALLPEVEAEAEKLRQEIKRGIRELELKREDLLRLLGRKHEDTFHRNAVGEMWAPHNPGPYFFKALELDVAELEHYPETVWDERVRNERAGHGYITDAAVRGKGSIEFQHGAGASITRFPNLGGDR